MHSILFQHISDIAKYIYPTMVIFQQLVFIYASGIEKYVYSTGSSTKQKTIIIILSSHTGDNVRYLHTGDIGNYIILHNGYPQTNNMLQHAGGVDFQYNRANIFH